MKGKLKNILKDKTGQEIIEYALMLALILLACALAIYRMSAASAQSLQTSSNKILVDNVTTLNNAVRQINWYF